MREDPVSTYYHLLCTVSTPSVGSRSLLARTVMVERKMFKIVGVMTHHCLTPTEECGLLTTDTGLHLIMELS